MTELRQNRYVERVREATRSLFEDLLEANRRLCLALAVVSEDRKKLPEDLQDFNDQSERWRIEQVRLLELLEAAERELKEFEAQVTEVEQQNSNLAALFAAGSALHSSLDYKTVLSSIEEIVINLIGSEQFAIVLADEALTPQVLCGITKAELNGLSPHAGIIGRASREGRPLVLPNGMPVDSTGVRVCVPLVAEGQTRGFVLIFGFLQQKSEIMALDHELFALVGNQAGMALHAAECSSHERLNNG